MNKLPKEILWKIFTYLPAFDKNHLIKHDFDIGSKSISSKKIFIYKCIDGSLTTNLITLRLCCKNFDRIIRYYTDRRQSFFTKGYRIYFKYFDTDTLIN